MEGDAVHRAGVIVRRREACEDRRGADSSQRFGERDPLARAVRRQAGRGERGGKAFARALERDVLEENRPAAAFAHGTITRTSDPAAAPARSNGSAIQPSARTSVKIKFDFPKTGVAHSVPSGARLSLAGT